MHLPADFDPAWTSTTGRCVACGGIGVVDDIFLFDAKKKHDVRFYFEAID